MKQFFILLLTSSLIIAQKTEDKFFSTNETLEQRYHSPQRLLKKYVDTIYFDTNFAYKIDDTFQEMEIGIRARGNFRRSTCYYPPIKLTLKRNKLRGPFLRDIKK